MNELTWTEPGLRKTSTVRTHFGGANPDASIEGLEALPARTNYFLGARPTGWHTAIPNYGRVRIAGIYRGIDLVFYGRDGQLEYDFLVSAGADPSAIEFRIDGAKQIRIEESGVLTLDTPAGAIRWKCPEIYQGGGERVAGSFEVRRNGRVRFRLGVYDRSRALVIDPALDYSSYFGGTGNDSSRAIATDSFGNVYIAGVTSSANLKVSAGSFQTAYGGETSNDLTGDGYVAKFNSSGALLWSTFLGGSRDDAVFSIAVDRVGNAYVTGFTNSSDFPVTQGVVQSKFQGFGGNSCLRFGDAFVTELNPAGTQLIYSTYLGGSADDVGTAIAIDGSGNAYIAGWALSKDFPVTSGVVQPTFAGFGGQVGKPACNGDPQENTGDAFVAKLNATATQLIWSTYLGGKSDDAALAIAIDGAQNVYVAGATLSFDFPTKNPIQSKFAGTDPLNFFFNYGDAFVAKLNSSATALMYSTYLGGTGDDVAFAIFVDPSGSAYVTGSTSSQDFPVTTGAVQRVFAGYYNLPFLVEQNQGDAFVARLSPSGNSLLYSSYLGGAANDVGLGIAVDAAGLIYVAGATDSDNFTVTSDAYQKNLAGDGGFSNYRPLGDGFFVIIDPNSTKLVYSTYFGGSLDDLFSGLSFDPGGNLWMTGGTLSTDLPFTSNAAQKTYGGGRTTSSARGDNLLVHFTGLASSPALSIIKSSQASSAGNPRRGDTFNYSIKVANGGGAAATSVTVQDTPDARSELALQGPLTFGLGTLAPGAAQTINIQASASAAGVYTNGATVTWFDSTGKASSASATTSTQVDRQPSDFAANPTAAVSLSTGVAQVLADGSNVYVVNNPGDSLTILNCAAGACNVTSTVPLGGGAAPVAVAKMDVDGDGINDILVLNQGTGTITALLSTNPGVLQVSAVGAGPVAIAPFNAVDGVARVAVVFPGMVAVFSWNGQQFQSTATAAIDTSPSGVVNGDFNGDGVDDLLLTDSAAGTVELLLGDGMGGLNLVSEQPIGNTPVALTAGDVDNSGTLDAAVSTADGLVVLLNDGAGNLSPLPLVPATGIAALVLGDFDGDGNLDLAAANATGASIDLYRGDGTGGLTPAGIYLTGRMPVSLAASDFDGDNIVDLISANAASKNLTILLFSNP